MQDCVDCRGIKPMSHLIEGLGTNNLLSCQVYTIHGAAT